jgi:hypothetical protein
MYKFLVRGHGMPASTWGEPFDGKAFLPLSVEEDPLEVGAGKVVTEAFNAKQIYKSSHSAMGIVDELCKIVCSDTHWNVEL